MGGYWTRVEWLAVNRRLAKLTKSQSLMTLWRLSLYETVLEGPAQHLKHVATARRQLIQQEDAVMRPRHLAGHGHLPAADPADDGNGVMGSTKEARGKDSGVAAFPSPPLGVPSGCRRSPTGLITRDPAGAASQSETGVGVVLGDSSLLVAAA
jgi:hypothetical protein